jgi:hypothetical protein
MMDFRFKTNKNSSFVMMIVAVVLVVLGLWVGASYLEANAYNNVTGKDVSVWDAMFLELRVQDAPE